LSAYSSSASTKARGLDGIELVAANAAVEDFLLALVGIEFSTRLVVDERNREREVIAPIIKVALLPSNLTECRHHKPIQICRAHPHQQHRHRNR
jgi:hypothetical protein